LAIINAVIMKFTEQLLPYIIKLVKKNQLVKQEIKASNVIKQTKTLTPFEVIRNIIKFRIFVVFCREHMEII
jgi:hypothetical protein